MAAGFSFNSQPIINMIILYTGYFFLLIFLLLIGLAFYFYLSHPIKMNYWQMFGSGKDGIFSFGKQKKTRLREVKGKKVWKLMFPLFSKKEIDPFDDEYIYPNQNVYAFKFNGEYIPARINVNKSEDDIRAEINPVPNCQRNWQSLQHKKNSIEFAEGSWWDHNKIFVYGLISIAICCVLCLFVIYYSYQFSVGGIEKADALTKAIQNINVIPSK